MNWLKYLGKKDPVKSMLHAAVGGWEPRRQTKRLHASMLTSEQRAFCSREMRLLDVTGRAPGVDWVDTARRITYDDGWDKQNRISNVYLREHAVGQWQCQSCGTVSKFGTDPKKFQCGVPAARCRFLYQEPVFIHALMPAMSGSVDLLVKPSNEKLRVVEIKIMSPKEFPTIKAPLSEHRTRTQVYLQLIAQSNHPARKSIDTRKASILYCMRSHGVKDEAGTMSPFKEFEVERADHLVTAHFDDAATLTQARMDGDGYIPPRICETQKCQRAKKCPVSKECFGAQDKPEMTPVTLDELVSMHTVYGTVAAWEAWHNV